MRVVVLSESEADEAALRPVIAALIATPATFCEPVVAVRGYTGLQRRGIIKGLYYNHGADGIVVVGDADTTELHSDAHDAPGAEPTNCRLCELRTTLAQVRAELRPVAGRRPLRTAVGVAVPAIEAWYLAGSTARPSEAGFRQRFWTPFDSGGIHAYKRALKNLAFGEGVLSWRARLEVARDYGHGMSMRLQSLRDNFPLGFGSLERDLRAWHG